MKRVFGLLVAALLLAAGFWMYQKLFPGDEAVIRRTLSEVEKYASFSPEEKPVSRLANVQKLARYFSDDVMIRVNFGEGSPRSIEGRDTLRQAARAARNTLSSLRLEFIAPQLQLSSTKDTAIALMTLKAYPSDGELQVQEVKLGLAKEDGRWIIKRVETVKNSNFKSF